MARPPKTGLDYFPLDVDIVKDIKIRRLLKAMGNARALGVYTYILCCIYKNGYFIDIDEDTTFIISEDLYEEETYIEEVIQYCIKVGLFDKDMYEYHKILTSYSIQKRYQTVQTHMKHTSVIGRYNLITQNENEDRVSSDKNIISSEETWVSSEEMNHNKVFNGHNLPTECVSSEKSFKKEIKKKEKNNKLFSSTTTPAREKDVVFKEFKDLDSEIDILVKDCEWIDSVTKHFNLTFEDLEEIFSAFKSNCQIRGKLKHQSIEDLKNHFYDWMNIQRDKTNKITYETKNTRYGTAKKTADLRKATPVPVGARQEDFGGTF